MRAERWPTLAVVVALGCALAFAGTDADEADAAFAAGDYARALALYDAVLVEEPSDVGALVQSGKLLSWDRRYDEALSRYARALAVDPQNRAALLERAKVLSWSRRFEESIAAYRGLLELYPEDLDAKLGLARVLSWSGDQDAARAAYREIAAQQPTSVEARVGIAQTYAWSGDGGRARDGYDAVLALEPGRREAVLGLAYLDLGEGDRASAARRLETLEAAYPSDPEVAELRSELHRAQRPVIRFGADAVADTDDNEVRSARLEAGFAVHPALDLGAGWTHWDLRSDSGDGRVDQGWLSLAWAASRRHRLSARLGADLRDADGADLDTVAAYGLTWRWNAAPDWQLWTTVRRDTWIYSPEILVNDVRYDAYEVNVVGRPWERWRLDAGVVRWDLDDGNTRSQARLEGWYGWRFGRTALEAGYAAEWLDYDRDLDLGYFDPQDFLGHGARVRVRGSIGPADGYWETGGALGLQSFTLGGVETSNDTVWGAYGACGVPLGRALLLEMRGEYSDYAAQRASGFASRSFSARLRWRLGAASPL